MKVFPLLPLLLICACKQPEPKPITISQAWLNQYISVQEALAADNWESAHKAIKGLLEKTEDPLKAKVEAAAKAGDMEGLRVAFKPLSEAIAKSPIPEGTILAFCPMAFDDTGAPWVQKDGQIMNPYFGASMLHCGAVTKKGGK